MTTTTASGRGLGASDCEHIADGLLAQPVAAVSSLAFVVAGGVVLWRTRGLSGGQHRAAVTYAGLLAATGLGSAVYHGPQTAGAQLMHDLPIALLVGQAIVVPLARVRSRVPVVRPGGRRVAAVAAAAAAIGLAAYAAGRTGSPLCDPDALAQPHAAWHAAAATSLAAWALALWPRAAA